MIEKKNNFIKICGVRDLETVNFLIKNEVDAVGFNFWKESKRYINPKNLIKWSNYLKNKINRIGLFVNESHDKIVDIYKTRVIDSVQLHGDESYDLINSLTKKNIKVYKAIRLKNNNSIDSIKDYLINCDVKAFLLDTYEKGHYGGTGVEINFKLAKKAIETFPDINFILAGGLTPKNVKESINYTNPFGVDTASGVENSPGIKNFDKIKKFIIESKEAFYKN